MRVSHMTLDEMIQIATIDAYGMRVVTVEAVKMIAVEHARIETLMTSAPRNYEDQVRVSGGMRP